MAVKRSLHALLYVDMLCVITFLLFLSHKKQLMWAKTSFEF